MEWWVILGLLLGVGAPLSAAGVEVFRRWRKRRSVLATISSTPLSPISEAARAGGPSNLAAEQADPGAGVLAVQGHARAVRTMKCPFSGEAIIGVRVTIEFVERVVSEHSEGPMRQIVDFTEIQPFEVLDETGAALVRGKPAVLLGMPARRDNDQFAVDLTGEWLEHRVRLEGFSNTDLVVAKDLSCHVRVLHQGSRVYVLGRSTREVDPSSAVESGYREAPTRLVLEPPVDGLLLVADCHHGELMESLQMRMH